MSVMNRRSLLACAGRGAALLAFAAYPGAAFGQSDLGSPQRIRQVKAALAVTPSQEGPWSDYVEALTAYRAAVREVRAAEIDLMGGAQAIDGANDAVLQERQSELIKAKAALKASYETFYGVLDPAQQRIADATLTAGECGR